MWDAVRMIAPSACPPDLVRIAAETAGVDMIPSLGTQMLPTPFPARTRKMICIASVL